jgi:hypothetical protein
MLLSTTAKGGHMIFQNLKKSLALSVFTLSTGLIGNALALAVTKNFLIGKSTAVIRERSRQIVHLL